MKIPAKYKGLICSLIASLSFSAMSAMVHLAGDLPSMQKALFRNLPALAFTFFFMLQNHIPFRVEPRNRASLLGRCLSGTAGLLLNFYAIDHLLLADANMLNKLSPFFAIVFSVFLLKEHLKPAQVIGVLSAFIGALFIIHPSGSNMALLPSLLGAVSGVLAGLAYTFVRKLGLLNENGIRIVFYFSLTSVLVTTPYFLIAGSPMSPRQFLILFGAGLGGALGQLFITRAYFYAPARELSVYDYMQVLFAALWGWMLFDQVPDFWSLLGYVIIVGAAVVMFRYNNRTDSLHSGEQIST